MKTLYRECASTCFPALVGTGGNFSRQTVKYHFAVHQSLKNLQRELWNLGVLSRYGWEALKQPIYKPLGVKAYMPSYEATTYFL